jgi:hypothetical protein
MAVDGNVDINPRLNKERMDKRFDNGSAVAELHDEFEAAMSEIFGIPLGAPINKSIFGDFPNARGGWGDFDGVRSSGAWTFCRFSNFAVASDADAAVGWEFRDNNRRVRLCQVSGRIEVWEFVGGTWEQVINIEAVPETSLTDLEDVRITPAQLNANNEGLCPQVKSDSVWGLGEDTTVSGADKWANLEDVVGTYYADLGAPGSVWRTNDDVNRVQSHILPGDVKIATSFWLPNFTIQQNWQPGYLTGWSREPYGSGQGFSPIEINPDDPDQFLIPTPGVYKVVLTHSMVDGNLSPWPQHVGITSRCYLSFARSGLFFWPSAYQRDEVWWKIVKPTPPRIVPVGTTIVNLHKKNPNTGDGEFGMHTFYMIAKGGDDCFMALTLYQNTKLGNKIMDFHLSFERIS